MPSRSIAKVMMVDSNFWSVVLNHVMTNVKKTVYYITAPPLCIRCFGAAICISSCRVKYRQNSGSKPLYEHMIRKLQFLAG